MAATASKNKPASKVAEQAKAAEQTERIQIVGDVFAWFGWKTKYPSPPITENEASEVDAWLYDCENDRLGTIPTPPAIWRFVDLPSRVQKHFRTQVDAMAMAAALMPDSGKYFEWLAEQGEPSEHGVSGSLADLPSETQTPCGTVFAELKGETVSIWFGRKAGQEPAFSGSAAVDAVKCLFDVADSLRRVEREVSPPVQPAPTTTTKSKQPKMVAKKADSAKDAETRTTRRSESATLQMVPLSQLQPAKENHRKTFDKDELHALAQSIESHGVLQPLLLRRANVESKEPIYFIIAGERRYRAALMAGLQEVPAQIVKREGVSESLAMLHENIMRVDLNPIERAQAIRRLMDEHSLSQKEVGQMVGCQQGQISNELRLLHLPESLQAMVAAGEIAPTLIRVVLPVVQFPTAMEEIVRSIEHAKKNNQSIEPSMLQNAMREAVKKHSRPMKYEADWNAWCPPNPKERHFQKLSPEDHELLDVQEFTFLHSWECQRRTFNIELFDKLNKTPLANRREKHRQHKEERRHSNTPKEKKSTEAKPFTCSEYPIKSAIGESLTSMLADVIEKSKDKSKVRAVCLTLMACAECISEPLVGGYYGDVETVTKLLTFFSAADSEKQLRDKLVSELRRDFHLDPEESIELAKHLGADLLQLWKPTDKFLQLLTDYGRELLTAAAGSVPEFLLPFFGVEAKKPAKAKKAKAA